MLNCLYDVCCCPETSSLNQPQQVRPPATASLRDRAVHTVASAPRDPTRTSPATMYRGHNHDHASVAQHAAASVAFAAAPAGASSSVSPYTTSTTSVVTPFTGAAAAASSGAATSSVACAPAGAAAATAAMMATVGSASATSHAPASPHAPLTIGSRMVRSYSQDGKRDPQPPSPSAGAGARDLGLQHWHNFQQATRHVNGENSDHSTPDNASAPVGNPAEISVHLSSPTGAAHAGPAASCHQPSGIRAILASPRPHQNGDSQLASMAQGVVVNSMPVQGASSVSPVDPSQNSCVSNQITTFSLMANTAGVSSMPGAAADDNSGAAAALPPRSNQYMVQNETLDNFTL